MQGSQISEIFKSELLDLHLDLGSHLTLQNYEQTGEKQVGWQKQKQEATFPLMDVSEWYPIEV